MKKYIQITEVAPRDGFQILPRLIPYEEKIKFIQSIIDAGCKEIEASSFVSPKWVPQLSDSEKVCRHFQKEKKTTMTYLVPNYRGAQRAIDAGTRQFFVTTSASVKHSRENLNQAIDEVLSGAEKIAQLAAQHGVKCTASIGAAFGYSQDPEGVSHDRVCQIAKRLANAGFSSITLCDTSGEANPASVATLCTKVIKSVRIPIGIHLHQADGVEFANALAALQAGVRVFESAVGGMGGCPYVKKAKGNIATEKLARMFTSMGYETGLDLMQIEKCADEAKKIQEEYGTPDCRID